MDLHEEARLQAGSGQASTTFIMAILTMSAALPWMGALRAARARPSRGAGGSGERRSGRQRVARTSSAAVGLRLGDVSE